MKKLKSKPSVAIALTMLAILIVAPTQAQADAVSDWNSFAIQRIGAATNPVHPTPVVFLDMAIVQIAIYDAVQAIEQQHQPYHVHIPGASGSPEAAAAKAAHDILVYLLPNQSGAIDDHYNQFLSDQKLSSLDPGIAVGATAAAGIIALRSNDGRFPAGQIPFMGVNAIGQWRPTDSFQGTPPNPLPNSPMAAPWVAKVKPFALKSGDQYRATPPPPLDSKQYTNAFNEVKAMGARFDSARTTDQTNLAFFWASNFPALWNRVVRDLAASQNLSIGDHARLSALVNLAMADATITAWDTKVTYNFWRPLTAIRLANEDPNPDTVEDPTWQPLINTPNYSDYSSGANNISAAATRMFALFFGADEMTFTVRTTNLTPGIPQTITYSKFSDAAEDVVNVRIWQGIHFRFADEEARKQGRHVAQWVYAHYLKPFDE